MSANAVWMPRSIASAGSGWVISARRGQQQRADALLDAAAEAQPAFADDRILDGADEEGARSCWRRSRVMVTSSATAASTIVGRRRVLPAARVGERLDALRELDEVPLLERAQQLVLVAKAGVEAAHRRAGAARDLGDRHRRRGPSP